jgi:hypothetical protein
MAIAGIGPTIFTLFIVWISFPTWGAVVYPELATFPDWAIKEIAARNMTAGATTIAPNVTQILTSTLSALNGTV